MEEQKVKKTICITGVAGFLGSSLAKYLLQNTDYRIIGIDNLTTGIFDNIADTVSSDRFKFYHFTIGEDKQELFNVLQHCSFCIHFAASVGVKRILEDVSGCLKNNINSTEHIVDGCLKYRIRCIISSSSEIYGLNESDRLHEDEASIIRSVRGRWSYAVGKIVDEFLALEMYKKYGLPTTIFRFFNISGAIMGTKQLSDYGMVIPRFIEQCKNNETLTIFNNGSQTRCFTHIKNVAEIITELLENPKTYGEVINVGNPEEISIVNIASYIKDITHSNSELKFNCEKEIYSNDFVDMKRRVPDSSKLEEILGHKINWLSYKDIVKDLL